MPPSDSRRGFAPRKKSYRNSIDDPRGIVILIIISIFTTSQRPSRRQNAPAGPDIGPTRTMKIGRGPTEETRYSSEGESFVLHNPVERRSGEPLRPLLVVECSLRALIDFHAGVHPLNATMTEAFVQDDILHPHAVPDFQVKHAR